MVQDIVMIGAGAGSSGVSIIVVAVRGQPVVGGVGETLVGQAEVAGGAAEPVAHGIVAVIESGGAGGLNGFVGQTVQGVVLPMVGSGGGINVFDEIGAIAGGTQLIVEAGQRAGVQLPRGVGQAIERIVLVEIRHTVTVAHRLQITSLIKGRGVTDNRSVRLAC